MGLLAATGIVAGYGARTRSSRASDLAVDEGEIVCIIGPNGAGKSTLLKAIAGLLQPARGAITPARPPHRGPAAARDLRASASPIVPQEHNVFPTMSVRENLEMGGYVDRSRQRRRGSTACWSAFRCWRDKRRHAARTLSGGERQILAMAMALMVEPAVLLLDEPSAGLSPLAAEALFDTIATINSDGVAIAMVEQNASEALAIAHRAYMLVDGRNSRTGPAHALAADPEIKRLFLGV